MPVRKIHKLEGQIGVREEATIQGPRRVLFVDTQDGDVYEIWLEPLSAATVAKALSPIALANGNGKAA